MLNTVEEIARLLHGSFLAERDLEKLVIEESDQFAFALKLDPKEIVEAWQLLRSLMAQTNRYPIVIEDWIGGNFFGGFYYEEEQQAGKLQSTLPASIIASALQVDLASFLESARARDNEYLDDMLLAVVQETQQRFGISPEVSHLQKLTTSGTIRSIYDLEKFMFEWELQHCSGRADLLTAETSYLGWFVPSNPMILLMPISNAWDALAYLHWYGACSASTTVAISFLRRWNQKYGAEIVCHYGTMLQLQVSQRPLSPAEAFELAWEQVALAPCTTLLPGVSLRDHARSLLTVDRWFLHERP